MPMPAPATAPTHRVDNRNLFFVAIHSNHRAGGTKTIAVVLVNSKMGIKTPSRIDGHIRRGLAEDAIQSIRQNSKFTMVSNVASRLKAKAKGLAANSSAATAAAVSVA